MCMYTGCIEQALVNTHVRVWPHGLCGRWSPRLVRCVGVPLDRSVVPPLIEHVQFVLLLDNVTAAGESRQLNEGEPE